MIKKILIVILLIANLPFHAESQTIGIEAGLKLPQTVVDYSDVDISHKIGLEAGVYLLKKIGNGDGWNSRVALLYSYSGFSLSDNLGDVNAGITYHFIENSAKLPMLFEWHLVHSGFIPFVQLGFYSSYALWGKLKAYGENSGLRYKTGGDRFDLGPLLGLGVSLTPEVSLTANYEYGLQKRHLALGDQFVLVRNKGGMVSLNVHF